MSTEKKLKTKFRTSSLISIKRNLWQPFLRAEIHSRFKSHFRKHTISSAPFLLSFHNLQNVVLHTVWIYFKCPTYPKNIPHFRVGAETSNSVKKYFLIIRTAIDKSRLTALCWSKGITIHLVVEAGGGGGQKT